MTAKDFICSLPEKVNKDSIAGQNTVFHFNIEGEGGGAYTLNIADGVCAVQDGLVGEPKCVVSGKDTNIMGIVTGQINPMMGLLTGKIKISNQGEMLKYAKILGLM